MTTNDHSNIHEEGNRPRRRQEGGSIPGWLWLVVVAVALGVAGWIVVSFLDNGGSFNDRSTRTQSAASAPAGETADAASLEVAGERFPVSAGWTVTRGANGSCTTTFPLAAPVSEQQAYHQQMCSDAPRGAPQGVAATAPTTTIGMVPTQPAIDEHRFPASAGWAVDRTPGYCTIHFPNTSSQADRAEYHRLQCVLSGYGRDGHDGPHRS